MTWTDIAAAFICHCTSCRICWRSCPCSLLVETCLLIWLKTPCGVVLGVNLLYHLVGLQLACLCFLPTPLPLAKDTLSAPAQSQPLGQTSGTPAPSAHRTCPYSSHSSKRDGVALEHPLFYTFHVTGELAQERGLYLLHTWVGIHLYEFLLLPIKVKHLRGFMKKDV